MAEVSAASALADEFYLPRDMIFEILTRLPVQNVLENKLVSREWRTLIACPHFIRTHLSRAPAALLIYARKIHGHSLFVHRPANQLLEPFLEFPGSDSLVFNHMSVVGAAPNGIFCISHRLAESFTLWNPSTRKALKIPGPDITIPITDPPTLISGVSTGFAFDRSQYAIVRIVRFLQVYVSSVDIVEVFNFQTGHWVKLGPVNFQTCTTECEAIVNGKPYWRAREVGMSLKKLVWFDLQTFRFSIEDFASPMLDTHMRLGEIREGCLGAIVWGHIEGLRNIRIWTRSEDGSWSQTYGFSDLVPPSVFGTFVGFYVDGMVADHVVYPTPEEEIKLLVKLNLSLTRWEYFCRLDDTWLRTCKVVRYKESLTPLPKIQNAA